MAYSTARLTLYAILGAMEEDLRKTLVTHILPQLGASEALNDQLQKKWIERYNRDTDNIGDSPSIEALLDYSDFQDQIDILSAKKALLPSPLTRYLSNIGPVLRSLVPIRNRVAHIRPLNFDDFPTCMDAARSFTRDRAQLWQNLVITLDRLRTEPSFVLSLQIPSYELAEQKGFHNLPLPDFDETGFIGRTDLLQYILKLALGPYPVVTILGDGGIGKTALALKAAYELLDLPEAPFDAVVWTSSKTSQLTPNEIVRIHGAIADSIGMFQEIADELVGEAANPLDDIIEYLEQFRILLVLDNLETVLDDNIRRFLERLPSGSKILITSRIGLGAFEFPVRMSPLDTGESIQLLRALSSIRGVQQLVKMNNVRLSKYCERMQNNPGFIKWFVSAVQANKRPEEVLDQPDIFLEFCMSNVYGYLDNQSRIVLRSLLCVRRQVSQAELTFLNDMDALELQKCIHQLLSTNMVSMHSIPSGSSFESRYELSELSREYLTKHHPLTTQEFRVYEKRRRQLVSAREQITAQKSGNQFSTFQITTRSTSDLIVAKHLLKALNECKKKHFENAHAAIDEARKLAPEYFEVHRCSGWILAQEGNITAARNAYEAALDLEPQNARLRFLFGGLLLRAFNEIEEALVQYKEALRLSPESRDVRLEIARAHMFRHDFDEADRILNDLIQGEEHRPWITRKVHDTLLQSAHRRAEEKLEQHDFIGALESYERFRSLYENVPKNAMDALIRAKLDKARRALLSCCDQITMHFSDDSMLQRVNQLQDWYSSAQGIMSANNVKAEFHGQVTSLNRSRFFGFIRSSQEDFFFHRQQLIHASHWYLIKVGTRVSFNAISSEKGKSRRAIDIIIEEELD